MSTTSSSLTVNAKYQRLVAEYQKLRTQVPLLKKAVVDEQSQNSLLTEEVKEKDNRLRKCDSEIESLTFRNQQLTKRVENLQISIEEQQKSNFNAHFLSNNKNKPKNKTKLPNSQSEFDFNSSYKNDFVDKTAILEDELNRKLLENENLHKQIHEIQLENEMDKKELLSKIDLLEINLSQCREQLQQVSSKHDHVINELNAKNKELRENMRSIEAKILHNKAEDVIENTHRTIKCDNNSISTSGNGSEITDDTQDNLVGEQTSPNYSNFSIATSSNSDNIQIQTNFDQKTNNKLITELQAQLSKKQRKVADLEKEKERILLDNQLLRVKYEQKSHQNCQNSPSKFDNNEKDQQKIDILKYTEEYYGEKIVELQIRLQEEEGKSVYFDNECKNLFKLLQLVKNDAENLHESNEQLMKELEKLKDESETVQKSYESQLRMLTEHLAQLNAQIAKQSDQIDHLKLQNTKHVSLKRK